MSKKQFDIYGKVQDMIQSETKLTSADNSGAKVLYCIKVLGGSKRRYASIGDIIVVSVKEAIPNAKVKKGDILSNLTPHNTHFKLDSINVVPEAKLLNKIPNFENKMFSERLSELNLDKSDLFQISKKVPLESSELKLKEEE